MELWCSNFENIQNRKLWIKQMSVLFCKYLANESSDLHEILYGVLILSWKLKFQISWRSVHKCARTSRKCACARFIASARVYDSYARICARIFIKISWRSELSLRRYLQNNTDFCLILNFYFYVLFTDSNLIID